MVIIAIDNCSLNGIVSCILKKCFMSNLKTGTLVHKCRQYICLFQPKVVGVIVFLLEKKILSNYSRGPVFANGILCYI